MRRKKELNETEMQSIRRVMQLIDDECGGKAQAFAEKTGIGKASLSHYKHFVHAPSQGHAYLISRAFDVNPMWVMGFDVPKHTSPLATLASTLNDVIKDRELAEALKKYFTFTPEQKKHVIDTINLLYEMNEK